MKFRVGGEYNAEDVVQEAFTRALRYHDSFNPRFKPLVAWFTTILNNAGKDFKKEEKTQGMGTGMTHDYESESLDDEMSRSQLVRKVIKEMEVSAYSEILRMYFLLGYTPKEITQVIDQKPQSVSNAVQRFKYEMREKYGEGMCR